MNNLNIDTKDPFEEYNKLMSEGNDKKNPEVLTSYNFKDKSVMNVILSYYPKKVKDHMENYPSYRVKYFDEKGKDLNYTYPDFYKNVLRLSTYFTKIGKMEDLISRDTLMGLIFRTYKIRTIDEKLVDTIVASPEGQLFKGMEEFLRKVLMGAHYGYYAEDNYLKYKNTKYAFGRNFNIVKYYLVLIGDTEGKVLDRAVFSTGRLTPDQAGAIWNKDSGTTVEQKAEYINILMDQIRTRYDKDYVNITNAWD